MPMIDNLRNVIRLSYLPAIASRSSPKSAGSLTYPINRRHSARLPTRIVKFSWRSRPIVLLGRVA